MLDGADFQKMSYSFNLVNRYFGEHFVSLGVRLSLGVVGGVRGFAADVHRRRPLVVWDDEQIPGEVPDVTARHIEHIRIVQLES